MFSNNITSVFLSPFQKFTVLIWKLHSAVSSLRKAALTKERTSGVTLSAHTGVSPDTTSRAEINR